MALLIRKPESMPVFEIERLMKRHGGRAAVENLSFTVGEGEVFGLLGPNGAGKTTTFNAVVGLTRLNAGRVTICGHDLAAEPLACRRLIGFVPDSSCVIGKLTASEHIDFVAAAYGVDPGVTERRKDALFELFELEGRRGDLVETFSHGMKKKVQIISALIHEPKALVIDEPFAALDPEVSALMTVLLRNVASRGTAVLLVTHDLSAAQATCDEVCLIRRGREIAAGSVGKVMAAAGGSSLSEAYLRLVGFDADSIELPALARP